MRVLFISLLLLTSNIPAFAEDAQPAKDIDQDAVVSISVREIQAIIAFNLESAKLEALSGPAKAAIAKIQAQAAKK